MVRRRSSRYSPYEAANLVEYASFSAAAEANNARVVSIQLKDPDGKDLRYRGHVRGYLSGDANGDTLVGSGPSGGMYVGTDGVVIPVPETATALLTDGNLAISGVAAEKFKTTQTAIFRIGGNVYTKAATDNLTFTAAHVVTAEKFGVILIQIDAAGTISTKVPGATQAYNTGPLALAALPSPDSGKCALGYITIEADAGDWTANTDDMTDASDLTAATFNDSPEVNSARCFELISESDGDVDLVLAESGVKTFYVCLLMPNGKLVVSSAIAFT